MMRRLPTLIMTAFALVTLLAGLSAAADRFTPVLMSVVTAPYPVRGTDGLIYLQYELVLRNYSPGTFTVERIEVLDARTGRVLSDVSGDVVPTRLRPFGGTPPSATMGPAQAAFVFLFPAFRTTAEVPRMLLHRLTLRPHRISAALGNRVVYTGTRVDVRFRRPIVLGPPLEGNGWWASGSCCLKAHAGAVLPINGRLFIAQRFAIDWIQLDAHGRGGTGDISVNKNWYSYGARLLAVRDGTVVAAVDGLPDRTPGAFPPDTTLQNVAGNHVVLDAGGGFFVFYAHMQPGSVRVKAGQRVRRGQVLGLLGNSGNTTAPHLHIHVMDGPSPLASNPLPYVFDRVVVRGRFDTDPDEEELFTTVLTLNTQKRGPQRGVLPLHNWVVDFPTPR